RMSQDQNSDRYFWSVASEKGSGARKLVSAASWIPDPVRLEREETEARMQADRDRRDQERADRKAQIVADNAARDAQHEQHLREVAAREKAVEVEVAAAQAAAAEEANAELAKAQKMLEEAQRGTDQGNGFIANLVRYITCWGLLLGGILYSRSFLAAKLPAVGGPLDRSYSLMGAFLPSLGVVLAVCALLGFFMSTFSGALLANLIPQLAALALGIVLGSSKMLDLKAKAEEAINSSAASSEVSSDASNDKVAAASEAARKGAAKLGPLLTVIDKNKGRVGVAAIAVGLLNLFSGGTFYLI
ncbi:MAG: hypothetical protein AAF680_04180, partial [Pseudomonadota bacterium]